MGGGSGGSGGAKAHAKPAWAGKGQEKKAEKAAQREARRAARAAASEAPSDAPKHDNPAWVCKFERERMGAEAFATRYGTNETKANAFGKCVSTEAHDRDGPTATDGEAPAATEPEAADPADQPAVGDDESVAADALAALRAFFNALTGLVF